MKKIQSAYFSFQKELLTFAIQPKDSIGGDYVKFTEINLTVVKNLFILSVNNLLSAQRDELEKKMKSLIEDMVINVAMEENVLGLTEKDFNRFRDAIYQKYGLNITEPEKVI